MNEYSDTAALLMSAHGDAEAWKRGMEAMQRRTAMGPLQIELVRVEDDEIEYQMPITDAARQPFGLLHGGISMLLAETAASSHACYGVDLTKVLPVGIEINGSHLRGASDGHVRAIARVIRRSSALIVHEVEIVHVESGKLLCTARVTNYYKAVG